MVRPDGHRAHEEEIVETVPLLMNLIAYGRPSLRTRRAGENEKSLDYFENVSPVPP
jgi:hypothetical protein